MIILLIVVLVLVISMIMTTLDVGFLAAVGIFIAILIGGAFAAGLTIALPKKAGELTNKLRLPFVVGIGGALSSIICFIVTLATAKTSTKVELIGNQLYGFSETFFSTSLWGVIGLFLFAWGCLYLGISQIEKESDGKKK